MQEIIEKNITSVPKTGSKKVFIESYGCQMNVSDSEIVASILEKEGYESSATPTDADLILLNTCSIREKAEQTVRKRLNSFQNLKKTKPELTVGVLGCMAERLKDRFLEEEKIVDLVVGPDAYRDLPNLLKETNEGNSAVNVILSKEETYADISPVRLNSNGVTAFVTIMRGCDNMCTFCVVPFTRGRERSRDPFNILSECQELWKNGYKEVTLLGQNVDSYLWFGGGPKKEFKKLTSLQQESSVNFSQLLKLIAENLPEMRIRFSTSNPQDMTRDVITTMAKYDNICKYIHLPIQSGSNRILKKMNRLHTREEYFELIDFIRKEIPDCSISYDMIAGFCDEEEEDHEDTLDLMRKVKYDFGYSFAYSVREGTPAFKKFEDNVPEETKKRRLREIIDLQQEIARERMARFVGGTYKVLIEGNSKRSDEHWYGRTTHNATVVFPKNGENKGDYVNVKIKDFTTATLLGESV